MFDRLKEYCKTVVPLTDSELNFIDVHFDVLEIGKRGFLPQEGKVCTFIGFIAEGAIRHVHIKEGVEKNV